MSRFFTSDQHFGHANILKHGAETRLDAQGRKLLSIDKMDDYLVDQWNATVGDGDVVYCLGDFSFEMLTIGDVLPFLNGEKILIAGNHDQFFKKMVSGDLRDAREYYLQVGFSEVHLQQEIVMPEIGLVKLSHFPYAPLDLEGLSAHELRHLEHRPERRKEKLLLHGHVHFQWLSKLNAGLPPMINVGVDVWKMKPVAEAEIVKIFQGMM
ncbi:MAG: hypothetical protein ACYCTH_05850 [Cellulomonas sp.]